MFLFEARFEPADGAEATIVDPAHAGDVIILPFITTTANGTTFGGTITVTFTVCLVIVGVAAVEAAVTLTLMLQLASLCVLLLLTLIINAISFASRFINTIFDMVTSTCIHMARTALTTASTVYPSTRSLPVIFLFTVTSPTIPTPTRAIITIVPKLLRRRHMHTSFHQPFE